MHHQSGLLWWEQCLKKWQSWYNYYLRKYIQMYCIPVFMVITWQTSGADWSCLFAYVCSNVAPESTLPHPSWAIGAQAWLLPAQTHRSYYPKMWAAWTRMNQSRTHKSKAPYNIPNNICIYCKYMQYICPKTHNITHCLKDTIAVLHFKSLLFSLPCTFLLRCCSKFRKYNGSRLGLVFQQSLE
jgi:hypothetical protein